MDRMTDRMLETLHGVFDKDAGRELALRVRRAGGLQWVVADEVLTLTHAGGSDEFDLSDITIAELADSIAAAGYEIAYETTDYSHIAARILLPGSGDQSHTNGDHLYVYTSQLWIHLDALSRQLSAAQAQVEPALLQLILPQAEDEWADLWGQIFGVSRLPGESDEDFTFRISEEVRRQRSNPASILRNIKALAGYDLEMREPWQEIFLLSRSALSGTHHLQGAPIWQYHTAQLIASGQVDWQAVMAVAEADRPAGTIFLDPATHYPPFACDAEIPDGSVSAVTTLSRVSVVDVLREGILSVNLSLSNYEAPRTLALAIFELRSFSTPDPQLGLEPTVMLPPLTFCRGEIILSEGEPIGNLNARFSGSRVVEVGEPLVLSGRGALSDYVHRLDTVPVYEWLSQHHASPVVEYGGMSVVGGSTGASFHSARRRNNLWSGQWDDRQWVESAGMAITESS